MMFTIPAHHPPPRDPLRAARVQPDRPAHRALVSIVEMDFKSSRARGGLSAALDFATGTSHMYALVSFSATGLDTYCAVSTLTSVARGSEWKQALAGFQRKEGCHENRTGEVYGR